MASSKATPEEQYEQQLAAGRTTNFSIIIGVHSAWCLGTAFVSVDALLPVFLQELKASNLVIGALPALMILTIFVPQVLAAQLTSHLPIKKNVFTCVHYPGAFAVLALGLLTLSWGAARPGHLIVATLVCIAVHGLALSFAMPMWSNLVAKLLPSERRGRSFGYFFLAGGITGVIGALGAKLLIKRMTFPDGFAVGFVICSALMAGGVTLFFFLREPPHPEPVTRKPFGQFVGALWRDLLGQRDYRFYLLSQAFAGLGGMAMPFYAVAAREQFGLDLQVGATYTAIILLARLVGSPLAGLIGDRFGFRALAFFSPAFILVASALALTASQPQIFYVVFALSGLARATESVAMINLPIEFCPHADKTSFLAVRGTVIGPVQAFAPLLGGILADTFRSGFAIPFTGAIAFEVLCLVVLARFVREPRNLRTER